MLFSAMMHEGMLLLAADQTPLAERDLLASATSVVILPFLFFLYVLFCFFNIFLNIFCVQLALYG